MKLVLTVMVRDEADIIEAMIQHHLAQGVDLIIATDNGSVDGTREILEAHRSAGHLVLHDDPVHMKQQHSTVTSMAREAYTDHQADWVINADADEFWVPVNDAITLHEALSHIPKSIQSFLAPVTDMTGLAAASGSQFGRLHLRDHRSEREIMRTGLLAHSTPNAVHVGYAEIEVAQGNHFVNLASSGEPAPEWAIEVLHLPWRSWEQYRRKVDNAGRAYEANPKLNPSPNHHGMRDYRRLKEDVLLPFYLLRHPTPDQVEVGLADGTYEVDDRLSALEVFSSTDVLFEPEFENWNRRLGASIALGEEQLRAATQKIKDLQSTASEDAKLRAELEQALLDRDSQILIQEDTQAVLEELINRFRARRIVRLVDGIAENKGQISTAAAVPRRVLTCIRAESVRLSDLGHNAMRLREVNRLLKRGLPLATTNGTIASTALPIVMCLWNRSQRIDTMLESFARQATKRNLRVILWNNAPEDAKHYRIRVHEFQLSGALDSIELHSNPINIGGMARFVVARTLWEQGVRGPFIMVDDDQDLSETFVEDSLAGYEAHSINSWWAFRNHGSHWNRSELEPGDTADYGGTGGAAVDLAIVEDLAFFTIPVRYFMLEDQWMSHYAHTHGWTIRKSSAQITAVLEETNQYHALRELKDEFFTYLHRDVG